MSGAELKKFGLPKPVIAIEARFLVVPVDDSEFESFFAEERIAATLADMNSDPNLKSYFLDDKDVDRLLKLVQSCSGASTLAAPRIKIFDGESASFRQQRTIRYGKAEDEFDEVRAGTSFKVAPKLDDKNENIQMDIEFELRNFLGFDKNEVPQIDEIKGEESYTAGNGQTVVLSGGKIRSQRKGWFKRVEEKEVLILIKAEMVEEDVGWIEKQGVKVLE